MDKIRKKNSYRTLHEVFDIMENIWATVDKFPILTKVINKSTKKIIEELQNFKLQKL